MPVAAFIMWILVALWALGKACLARSGIRINDMQNVRVIIQ